jgi:hypothetical protein
MSMLPGKERAEHERARWADDFYIEPAWAVEVLFDAIRFRGPIHDPAAGSGTIVRVAQEYGYQATGADLVDRGRGFPVRDFLTDQTRRASLVFNAPYGLNEAFIAHANLVASEFAAIVRLSFLAGQERQRALYSSIRPSRVLILAQRPSMPPGDTDVPAKGGTTDYCWIHWRRHGCSPTILEWLPPRSPRAAVIKIAMAAEREKARL